MDALRLPPGDADVTTLSGGERRRVALCRVLLEEPDMLLLDEPTNHLDAESVAWLERHLAEFPGTVVAVTHDRYFLDNVAEWILELDRGQGIPYEGNYTAWLEQKRTRLAQEEKQASARQRTLARELEWVRMAPRARQAKSQGARAALRRAGEGGHGRRVMQNEIVIPPPPRLGNDVVIAKDLKKSFGDTLLFDDMSFALPRGGIVGVIGPNGAGKTTLFRMIAGQEKPDSGTLKIGETVQLAYVDQSRELDGGEDRVAGNRAAASETMHRRQARDQHPRVSGELQLPRRRSAEESRRTSRAASATACISRSCSSPAATCCCSTSRRTISTSTRCARSKRRYWTSRAARWSSRTIAGSSTASRRTFSRSRGTAKWCGSRGTTARTPRISTGGRARTPTSRTGSSTRSWCASR